MAKVGELLVKGANDEGDEVWEDVQNAICDIVDANPSKIWNAKVNGFGWRNVDGHRNGFKAETAEALLFAILPNTGCTFEIYRYGRKGLAINNAHHDKPTGGEWYYITPAKA